LHFDLLKENMINPKLLNILCCPETKADLVLDGQALVSTDATSRRRYKIINDIPIMLIDESEILRVDEWNAVMKKAGKLPKGNS
jgi:uncharacterized protein YbaR (Trm112 family)